MPLEWGVIWTADDEEQVHTTSLATKQKYENVDQVKKDIEAMPWMNGQAVFRNVSDWKVPAKNTVDSIPMAQSLAQYERDTYMRAKVEKIEAERRAMRS